MPRPVWDLTPGFTITLPAFPQIIIQVLGVVRAEPMHSLDPDPQLVGCPANGLRKCLFPGLGRPEDPLEGETQLLCDLSRQRDIPALATHAHHMQQALLLVHILAFQAGQLRDPQPTPQSQFGHRGERRSLFFQEFHDLYGIFFLITEAWLVHVAVVTIGFHMLA
jgi:hypothetical protein